MRDPKFSQGRTRTAQKQPIMPWRFLLLTFLFAAIIAVGFFFAARQHFTSIDLGIKNSTLRKQLEDLEAEHRRLVLAREVSLSPVEVLRAARSMGFSERQTEPIVALTVSAPMAEKPSVTVQPIMTAAAVPTAKPARVQTKAIVETMADTKRTPKPLAHVAAVTDESRSERPRRVATELERRVPQPTASFSKF